jgi:RNA polymerase sigma factor (sigma-70 family)
MNNLLRRLRGTLLASEGAGDTDGQLLERFVTCRDRPALDLLVRRHAAMVWGVCRRVLRDRQAAEDAFQATFLVLVRRAAAVSPREMVANWLYGVAHQTARKARATLASRTGRERVVSDLPHPPTADRVLLPDLRPILDQELFRLPDRYRAVVVLTDLEGKTRAEVARELGVAEGTVASRLARGRAMLADRLSGRGIVLSVGSLAAAVTHATAATPPPVVVVFDTPAAVSALAAAVTRGAGWKFKGVGVLLVAAVVAGGIGVVVGAGAPDLTSSTQSGVVNPADLAVIQGRWRAARVAVGGEVVHFTDTNAPEYLFADDQVEVTYPAEQRRGRFGPPPVGLSGEERLRLATQFGGRGGPWAGLDPDQRRVLANHLRVREDGRVGIVFSVRIDQPANTIDRFLAADGVERLTVRGEFTLSANTLVIREQNPRSGDRIAPEVESVDWTFTRAATR